MLKSLKLGELGIDPLLLASVCRSEVVRNKVRNMFDIHKEKTKGLLVCRQLSCKAGTAFL